MFRFFSLKINNAIYKTFDMAKLIKAAVILSFITVLPGCQLLSPPSKAQLNFGHYYVWIKSLSEEEMAREIAHQKQRKQLGSENANVQLIMLYSLPKSTIHNPYTAKSLLNEYQLSPNSSPIFNGSDLAFVIMLKDQLNQQLLLLEKIKKQGDNQQQTSKQLNQHQLQIKQLQQQVDQLNKQIIQLQKIEKAISERG